MSGPAFWDRLRSRLVFQADLVAVTGLRVGQGQESFEPTGSDLPVLRGPDAAPYIPGSSLRGVLRAYIERVVRTYEFGPSGPGPWRGRGACNPLSEEHKCLPPALAKQWRKEHRQGAGGGETDSGRQVAEAIWDYSCRVCRVFGSTFLASRVRVSDLLPAGQEPLTTIRDGVSIDREKETVENKYDFEIVEPGATFNLVVVAENLEAHELGLLFLGLQALGRGEIEVGGFKGRGLGRVSLEHPTLRWLDAGDRAALRSYLKTGVLPTVTDGDRQIDNWVNVLLSDMEEVTG